MEEARFPLGVGNAGACHTPLPEAGGRDCGLGHREWKKWDNGLVLGCLGIWFGRGEGGRVACIGGCGYP